MVFSHLRPQLILLAILLLGACDSHAGLKIYYIRHAEAGHNVAKEWAIELAPDEAPYFFLREDGQNNFKKPPFPPDHADKEGEAAVARLVIQRVLDMIQERFGGSDKTILLVGHGSSGMGVLRMLTNETPGALPSMTNTGIWMLEEQAMGEFELKIFNDVPLRN